METIDIIFEENRSKEVFKKYFKFERQQELKKVPVWIIAGVCATMIGLGLLFKIHILWILGLTSALIAATYLLIFFLRFQIVMNKFMRTLEQKAKSTYKEFQFSFDSESIKYNSEHMSSEIKWSMINNYVINDGDIYLHLDNRELLDIISEDVLGVDKFIKFRTILNEKANRK